MPPVDAGRDVTTAGAGFTERCSCPRGGEAEGRGEGMYRVEAGDLLEGTGGTKDAFA